MSGVSPQYFDGLLLLEKLRTELNDAIVQEQPSVPISTIAQLCISIRCHRSFPIVHERSLRADATYFFGAEGECFPTSIGQHGTKHGLALMRSFTVLTVLCAAQSFLFANTTIQYGAAVGPKFLAAARAMFHYNEDVDRQTPDATSLQVRMLLSTCIQQHTGESGLAYHLVNEASLIARRLRLYRESVVSQYPPLEATLLRNAFWSLYSADSSAICCQNRAVILYEPLFDAEMDLQGPGLNQVPLLDCEHEGCMGTFELGLLQSFHYLRRTWGNASRLLLSIRQLGRMKRERSDFDPAQLMRNREMYIDFSESLDDIPAILQPSKPLSEDGSLSTAERSSFISLRYRLLSTYYFSKLMIIHECRVLGFALVLGLRDDDYVLASEEVNAARDYILTLQSVEFHVLQELGEPAVSLSTMAATDSEDLN